MIAGIGSLHHRTWILRRFAVFFDVNCQLLQFPESGGIYQKPCVSLYKPIFLKGCRQPGLLRLLFEKGRSCKALTRKELYSVEPTVCALEEDRQGEC